MDGGEVILGVWPWLSDKELRLRAGGGSEKGRCIGDRGEGECAREGVPLDETKDGVARLVLLARGRNEEGDGGYGSFPLKGGYLLSRPADGLSVIA